MLWSIPQTPGLSSSNWLKWLVTFLLSYSMTVSAKSAADYYVKSLPGQPEGPLLKMHAGHVEVDPENNGNLFFWHFENRHIADRQRTVIWLNGGPGCSSMDGALMEVGPYRLKDKDTLEYNDGSWDEFAHLLFVDNPVGTGFSYVNTDSYLHELHDMASQFVTFLEEWFRMFPQYEQDDLYIAGESYAGQHIPYIAQAILDRNNDIAAVNQNATWNLKGLLLGNAWISPPEQYQAYLTYTYNKGIIQGGTPEAKRVEAKQTVCMSKFTDPASAEQVSIQECEEVLQEILKESRDKNKQCINMYDIRLRDTYKSCGMNWPPDLEVIEPYLRRPDVTSALHINKDKKTGWVECSGAVGGNFHPTKSKPSVHLLPGLLEAGVPITLFSGDQDLICNHEGTEELIKNMKWSGGSGFELSPGLWAPRHDWTFEGESAGIYQEARNLTYVLFYNSSHMVPFDYPRRTRDMLDRFLGVNIKSIGGSPADSRLDGSKGPLTSVGEHANETVEEESQENVESVAWDAYYRSGEVALIVVIIAASVWGFFVWRSHRQQKKSGYQGVYHDDVDDSSGSFPRFRNKRSTNEDIEAADFDESELDNLPSRRGPSSGSIDEPEHYAIGDESSDENDAGEERKANSNGLQGASSTEGDRNGGSQLIEK